MPVIIRRRSWRLRRPDALLAFVASTALLAGTPVRATPGLPDGVLAALGRAARASAGGHSRAEARALIDAAEESANPVLASRATLVAYSHRHFRTAHTAALLWRTLAPHDPQAVSFLFLTDFTLGRNRQGLRRMAELLPPGAPWIGEDMMATLLIRRLPHILDLRIAQLWHRRHPHASGPRYLLGLVALRIGMSGTARLMAHELAGRKLTLEHRLRVGELASQALVYGGRPRRGLKKARALLESEPKSLPLAVNLISLELVSGHNRKAHALALRWRRIHPHNGALFLALALADLHRNHPRRARAWLTRLLETGRAQSVAAFNIGRVEVRLHHPRRARFWFRWAAARAERDAPGAALALARLAGGGKDTPAARAVFRRYAARVPLQAPAILLLEARWLTGLRHAHAAQRVLLRAHKTFPQDPDVTYALALADMGIGRGALGYRLLRTLEKRYPENAWILNAEGYYLARHTARLSRARRDIVRALALDPGDPPILDSRGWVSYRQSHYRRALALFRRAYAHDRSPTIALHYGLALWHTGHKARARALWSQVYKRHPHDRALAETLARHAGS
jgi:Tfp pilus assembly protein PilF